MDFAAELMQTGRKVQHQCQASWMVELSGKAPGYLHLCQGLLGIAQETQGVGERATPQHSRTRSHLQRLTLGKWRRLVECQTARQIALSCQELPTIAQGLPERIVGPEKLPWLLLAL